MFQLIYCSIARPGLVAIDIRAILESSRRFNKANNITGCLLYHAAEFMQIIEGDKAAVQQLFLKIKQDERHFGVVLMLEEEVEARMFSSWSMAYCNCGCERNECGNLLFQKNFIALTQVAEKPTQSMRLFFHIAKLMLITELII